MKQIAYRYKNLPIPGGGYVTGFLFHEGQENLLYIRTDIGGCYRFDYEEQKWICLSETVSMDDLSETYPSAIAIDENDPKRLYIISGKNEENATGVLSISDDQGKHYIRQKLPFFVHGNLNGRGCGYRLVKDPLNKNGLYYASQKEGLFYSGDLGDSWEKRQTGDELVMTFVAILHGGETVIAGTAGVVTGTESMRGHSLYISYDRGAHFEKMLMPASPFVSKSRKSGYVAHRYAYDGTYFYVTLSCTGERSYIVDHGYSCDSGDALSGRVLRYSFDQDHHVAGYEDITPTCLWNDDGSYTVNKEEQYPFGFGGISVCKSNPGLLAASTICKDDGDMVFLSKDYGNTWEAALYDLQCGNMHFHTSYMKPEYNGGKSLIHWLSDIKINPFCPDEIWFNSGTGVFRGTSFTKEDRSFCDCTDGIEETVHLNVYSLPSGPVQVIDIVGDLGGFAFQNLDKAAENSFADKAGNRYITCINADFTDRGTGEVIVTARGNWTGKTQGGLILSKDYGQTFERIPMPYGISAYLDKRFHAIETPNVNAGWVALSCDGEKIVYGVAEGIDLYMKGVITSGDQGDSFQKTKIFSIDGEDLSESDLHFKVFSDRVNPELFYGFGDDFKTYLSKDGGVSFYEIMGVDTPKGKKNFGLIDTANKTEIRAEAGKEGIFYCAVSEFGLYKVQFIASENQVIYHKLTKDHEKVYRVGLGRLDDQKDYFTEKKAIYISGEIDGEYGFYQSLDDGATFQKISTKEQAFGEIISIDGDCRKAGRFFLATGSFGLKYGEPIC